MFHSFRSRILLSLLGFVCINFFFVLHLNVFLDKREQILGERNSLEIGYRLLLKDFLTVKNFFYYESYNDSFYLTGSSQYIDMHERMYSRLSESVTRLHASSLTQDSVIHSMLDSILSGLSKYDGTLQEMKRLMIEKGYKDYGTVGRMRLYAHCVEAIPIVAKADVLQLRRHEKDFIIRNDESYAHLFLMKVDSLLCGLKKDKQIKNRLTDSVISLLENYRGEFEQFRVQEKQLGYKSNTGLKYVLNLHQHQLDYNFQYAIDLAATREKALIGELTVRMYLILFTMFVLSVVLARLIARKVTWRLSEIMAGMRTFVASGFETKAMHLECVMKNDELGELIHNYRLIEDKVVELIKDFKRKVDERTKEVVEQKEQIEVQNEEIKSQRDELFWQNQYIEEQKGLVEKQNSQILDSFRYAAGIQLSLMPDKNRMKETFAEHFVLFKPLDIISGDYYWVHRIKNKHTDLSFFVVADCTGHGVPGALMSMLGIAYLNELIVKQQLASASDILQKLRENIKSAMLYRKSTAKAYDGMDIALAVIDNRKSKLYYSGANRNLLFVRDKKMEIIRGDKMPIGHFLGEEKSFTLTCHKLKKGDCIYAYSDGYPDQFGGPNDKKFTSRRLNDLLLQYSDKSMNKQQQLLSEQLYKWKGDQLQIDDILLLGVRWA